MSKKKMPERLKRNSNRNLATTEPDKLEAAPEPEQQPEPERPEPKPTGNIPKLADADNAIRCEGPGVLEGRRKTKLIELATDAVNLMITDIAEALVSNPHAARYETPVGHLPNDVINIVVASMHQAGWDIYLMDDKNIVVALPKMPEVVVDVIVTAPSSINPL